MRCYKIKAVGKDGVVATRYAGTNADAKDTRDQLVQKTGLKKKDVSIDQDEVPMAKADLLDFINALLVKQDR